MEGSFYGWYFKCQSGMKTLAIIPAVHRAGRETASSIQLITDKNAWTIPFSGRDYGRRGTHMAVGENRFGEEGLRLCLHTPELEAAGSLRFGRLSPPRYDIMGPFSLVPFMECRHSVFSMRHKVSGRLVVNGEAYDFQNAWGYWEGDRGRSFPRVYAWTQCCFPGGSLMLSVAEIPLGGVRFTGIVGFVFWRGREYRLATYLGARAVFIQDGVVRVAQGGLELEARMLCPAERPLKAPAKGAMARTIHESAACRAAYRFRAEGRMLLSFSTEQASFEYEYPD